MIQSNRDILEELRLILLVKEIRVSLEEREAKSLDGLPLRIEEERRTEALIFEIAYGMFYGDANGKLAATYQTFPRADQRTFELDEFKRSLRLERTGAGKLPSYILAAHAKLIAEKKPVFLCAA